MLAHDSKVKQRKRIMNQTIMLYPYDVVAGGGG